MSELLIFAHDHSLDAALAVTQIAALPKLHDLITHQADGWKWGKEELANPWFRVISWPDVLPADLDTLLAPLRPSATATSKDPPQFLGQYRGFRLDLTDLSVPAPLTAWWADTARAQAMFKAAAGTLAVATLKKARPPIANPAFVGVTPSVIG